MTDDRDKWRKYVHGVDNPQIEDGYRQNNSLPVSNDGAYSVAAQHKNGEINCVFAPRLIYGAL